MLDTIKAFIYKYYISGIINDASYNIVDTLTYALILGISIFAVLRLLKRLNVEVDKRFILAVTPYILAGATLRVIEDTGILQPPLKYLFITPPIYFLVFAITVLFLFLSITTTQRTRHDWHSIFAFLGIAWFAIILTALLAIHPPERPFILVIILALGTATTALVYTAARKTGLHYLTDTLNISILAAHLIDASSTFVGVDLLGYYEKHVVPTFFIDLTGTAAIMYPLKLAIFLPVIYLLDTELGEDEATLKNLVKLVVLTLGLSPAVRNTLRMTLGV